ncbi:MAG: PmeII family type II restriction endonuclease [Bacteroidota bacterium]
MKQLKIDDVFEYAEKQIAVFHKQRLDAVSQKIGFNKLLEQKNPYLFKAKNILTAQDLVKGFVDAFLQSQEETLFGNFIEGLAIFVCDKVYGAKKIDQRELTGMDLKFEKDNTLYVVENQSRVELGKCKSNQAIKNKR